jgi:Family of unknown function (DUF6159)
MFDRISNGFAMAKSSWHVVMSDKKLLLFPIVSGILFVLVAASFIVPMAVLIDWDKVGNGDGKLPIWFYPVAFAFYFCTYFVVIFCNAALVSCALLRFNGEECTVGDGFRAAMARLPQILGWALVSASVGLLLKIIENAHEKAGYWIAAIIGTAWSIMTYFVVPILVVEKVGPIQAVKNSTSLIKRTWGEALVGKLGIGLFLFLLSIPLIILMVLAVFLAAKMPVLGIALLIVVGILFLLYMAISAALNTVFMTAVYQYAANDRVPDGFDRHTMAHAFATK